MVESSKARISSLRFEVRAWRFGSDFFFGGEGGGGGSRLGEGYNPRTPEMEDQDFGRRDLTANSRSIGIHRDR